MYRPNLSYCYKLWDEIDVKMRELKIDNPETSEWLEEIMENHIHETKQNIINSIDDCIEFIYLYNKKSEIK